MQEQIETILEGQKQLFSWWTDASKKTMDAFLNNPNSKKEDFWTSWLQQQKTLLEQGLNMGNWEEAWKKAPEQWQNWANTQNKLTQQWTKFYAENAKKYGFKMPDWQPTPTQVGLNEADMKQWAEWLDKNVKWVQEAFMDRLPFNLIGGYWDFFKAIQDMEEFWNKFLQLITMGVYDQNTIKNYFSPQAYNDFLGKLLGFGQPFDVSSLIQNTNKAFEQYLNNLQSYTPDFNALGQNWQQMLERIMSSKSLPIYQSMLELAELINATTEPFYNLAGRGKEVQIARILKDIQVLYIQFLTKNSELQTEVVKGSQKALPETLEFFHKNYQDTQNLPDYKSFINKYINVLETYIINVFHSPAYSEVQNDVAVLNVKMKAKLEELVELSASHLPFLTNAHADEVAKETHTLRTKIRTLENKISGLELRLEEAIKVIDLTSSYEKKNLN